ncbi:hypothetical protein E1A91_D10G054500v1 [Gossypium mustelinum]|uniref:Uncharacterized protein n=1 Tax=Gossypium mustelinum TaxID=34275 RepID=A0A5D2T6B0_GOSMU|nr:hypothetical protein E1A91_D10G054500v1 [Gossypium mustelinum]
MVHLFQLLVWSQILNQLLVGYHQALLRRKQHCLLVL